MREMWNEKFNRDGLLYGEEANNFIKENYTLIKRGSKVLCLGEGEGRNALFLSRKGYDVTALDASDVGLDKLKTMASKEDLSIHTKHMLVSQWSESEQYEGIVCTYMHLFENEQKDMFAKAIDALHDKGYFIAEFFSVSQLDFESGGPKNIALLYRLDDLYKIFSNLPCKIHKLSQEIVYLQEGSGHNGEASVIRVILEKEIPHKS
ncbi:MAG: methyltransferase domain-containing protein [Sulfurospirillaceae bacterium]|nr:methyltransferase domain-containing protein [Sulfurospirillaceae bacterium]